MIRSNFVSHRLCAKYSCLAFRKMGSSIFDGYLINQSKNNSPMIDQLFNANKTVHSPKMIAFINADADASQNQDILNSDNKAEESCIIHSDKSRSANELGFRFDDYFDHLHTRNMGRYVIYFPRISSTMFVLDPLMFELGNDPSAVIVIAGCQVRGMGRGRNVWVSPEGCAMFSLAVKISSESVLGRRIGWLQHLVAVAVVDSLQPVCGQYFDLRIKWPNDIYLGSDKIGGVLVKSSIQNSTFYAVIGCGVNVSNQKPTVCINSALPADCQPLTRESVISSAVSRLEQLLLNFEIDCRSIENIYYKYWMHSAKRLTIAETKEEVIVQSLDEHGYLSVRSTVTNQTFSVQPNGHSLDVMQGLIKIKSN